MFDSEADWLLRRQIGARIRMARELQFDLRTLGSLTRCSHSHLSRIERGLTPVEDVLLVQLGNMLRTGMNFLGTASLASVEASLRHALIVRHPELLDQQPPGFGELLREQMAREAVHYARERELFLRPPTEANMRRWRRHFARLHPHTSNDDR